MDASITVRLASLLGCAPQGLPSLASLSEAEVEQLCTVIEQSLGRHEQAMTEALPELLRPLLAVLRSRP